MKLKCSCAHDVTAALHDEDCECALLDNAPEKLKVHMFTVERERDKLKEALAELTEKVGALLKLDLCDTLQNPIGRELDDLEEATAKANAALGEKKKEKQVDTCILTDSERKELVQKARNLCAEQMRPSTLYNPRVYPDGDMWCALYGVNIQEGVAGFGESPALAMEDFDANWNKKMEKKGEKNGKS